MTELFNEARQCLFQDPEGESWSPFEDETFAVKFQDENNNNSMTELLVLLDKSVPKWKTLSSIPTRVYEIINHTLTDELIAKPLFANVLCLPLESCPPWMQHLSASSDSFVITMLRSDFEQLLSLLKFLKGKDLSSDTFLKFAQCFNLMKDIEDMLVLLHKMIESYCESALRRRINIQQQERIEEEMKKEGYTRFKK